MLPYGHIDLRVRDVDEVYPFYAAVLPQLGFPHEWRGDRPFSFQTEGTLPATASFALPSR